MQKDGISMITRLAVNNFKAMANFELKNLFRMKETRDILLTAKDGILKVLGEESYQYSNYNFQGSILSAFHFKNSEIEKIKAGLSQLQSLELLSPANLRRSSQSGDSLGPDGKCLPGFLSRVGNEQSRDLLKKIVNLNSNTRRFQ